ncbi:putative thioesterase [Pyrobaculum oguniense TE7]|uniref:Thioesterase n=1 Tax=Pyrobaculum oguniense (strain DSM 13380 / JCM 10595 / TE7) TaxID=698757 RepID=H6Q8Z7_PYROT|nr:putative thioesterase [Pyrobaculum oguniense TE7]
MKVKERYLVALGDTDATGAIYYATYLYVFDRARIALYRETGLDLSIFNKMRAVAAYTEFKKVVTFGDVLDVYIWFCKLGNTSVKMCHEVYLGEQLAARGYVVDVYTENGRPTPIPADIREKIEKVLEPENLITYSC